MAGLFGGQGTNSLKTMQYDTFSKNSVSASSFVTTWRKLSFDRPRYLRHIQIDRNVVQVCHDHVRFVSLHSSNRIHLSLACIKQSRIKVSLTIYLLQRIM